MEGQGAYNRHARQQAAGGVLAVPLLEQAARLVDLRADDTPLLIADYGSSQGGNSMPPIRAAISVLRQRVGAERPICVTHTDLPGNDFAALFQTLHDSADSYLRDQPNVFPSAIGRSFYQPLFPAAQVTLGWSSYAAQWLSRPPAHVPGHFYNLWATGAERAAFDVQAAADWQTFLSLRARELRPTGRLVVLLPAIDDAGRHGIEPMFDAANDCIGELLAAGTITAAERARMIVPDRLRNRAQLLAPFATTGSFAGLTVEHCEISRGPDAVWEAYRQHGDASLLATQRARFFRATFAPTLAAALDPTTEQQAFADALETALALRLHAQPIEIPQTLATMVLARQKD
jgi:hypothetical protein